MPNVKRVLNIHGQIQCPGCGEWNFLHNHTRDVKRSHGAGTYCLRCYREKARTKYSPAAKRRAEKYREEVAQEQLANYKPERVGPPIKRRPALTDIPLLDEPS
jgi:hypothetical protein